MSPSLFSSPSDRTPVDPDVLDRYLAGEASPDERARVEEWMAAGPELALVTGVVAHAELAGPVQEVPELDLDADWAQLRGRLETPVARPERPAVRVPQQTAGFSRRHFVWGGVLAAAATVAVVVTAPWNRLSESQSAVVYQTARAEQQTVTLEDGTHVVLGPESRLEASNGGRDVHLVGEAFFNVKHQADRPFTVSAAGATAVVLGTEFAVRAYEKEGLARIAVVSGRVQVDPATVLSGGDMARVGKDGVARVVRNQSVEPYRAWAQGELQFDNVPLSAVVDDLARWYDIEIRVTSPLLLREHITAAFGSNQLDYVVQALTVALDARIERSGRIVTISPGVSHPSLAR